MREHSNAACADAHHANPLTTHDIEVCMRDMLDGKRTNGCQCAGCTTMRWIRGTASARGVHTRLG